MEFEFVSEGPRQSIQSREERRVADVHIVEFSHCVPTKLIRLQCESDDCVRRGQLLDGFVEDTRHDECPRLGNQPLVHQHGFANDCDLVGIWEKVFLVVSFDPRSDFVAVNLLAGPDGPNATLMQSRWKQRPNGGIIGRSFQREDSVYLYPPAKYDHRENRSGESGKIPVLTRNFGRYVRISGSPGRRKMGSRPSSDRTVGPASSPATAPPNRIRSPTQPC